jgi:uncharacterized membrane protein SpoIIM required for sporulation
MALSLSERPRGARRGPTEAAFVERRQRDWDTLDSLVRQATQRGLRSLSSADVARLSPLYRDVCADLARAEAERYGAPLLDYLHGLTAASHTIVYAAETGARAGAFGDRARRWVAAFPRAFRANGRYMAWGFALFFVPFFAGLFMTMANPDYAFKIVPESMIRPLTEAYAKGFDEGRGFGGDALMAGFYVDNNIGIALRCFALGIFGGVGSVFYLIQNGLFTGAVFGYVATHGGGENILTFVVGHSSFELGAIAIAGGAGLRIGWSIVAPGDRTRLASLQAAGRDAVVLVSGAAAMLLMAAAIEGFWSASPVPSVVKRGIGVLFFVAVAAFLAFVGRDPAPVVRAR